MGLLYIYYTTSVLSYNYSKACKGTNQHLHMNNMVSKCLLVQQ